MSPRSLSRLAWGICAVALAVGAAMLPLKIANGASVSLNDVTQLVAFASIAVVGGFVAANRPRNPLGWIYLGLALTMIMIGGITLDYARYGLITHPGSLPFARVGEWLSNWMWVPPFGVLLTFAFLLFPDGHLPSPRWRAVPWIAVVGIATMSVSFALQTADYTDVLNRHVTNPYTTAGLAAFFDVAKQYAAVIMLFAAALSVASLIVRYRRGTRDERQQLKWLMFAAVLLVIFVSLPVDHGAGSWTDSIMGLLLAFVPIACGVAILKYRLYDIDLVINRAVVFGALAVFITAVYVGIVVGIGELFGGGRANAGLQITATAVVALAFQPVRRRVQRIANRLVYGRRATPYEVLSDFSRRMAGTLGVGDALPQMAEAAARGVGAVSGRIRLFLPGGGERAIVWPPEAVPTVPTRAIEVRHQGEPIGEIAVTKAPGDELLPAEDALLQDLATQAGLAMHNVRLTDELEVRLEELAIQADQLRTSRQRLVTARDAQRRGLERDIREGPRHTLGEIAAGVDRARELASAGRADDASAELDRLGEHASATLEGLRDLARGIFPPLLADKGILAALDAHIRKIGVRASIDASPGFGELRFDDRAEACVYFCCLQALQNVVRHAGTSEAVVRLATAGDTVSFEVTDAGTGFDPAATGAGMGLQIMRDRVDALEGSLEVSSASGAGTTVRGRIRARALEVAAP
jgi:signal transduction histidine kinase